MAIRGRYTHTIVGIVGYKCVTAIIPVTRATPAIARRLSPAYVFHESVVFARSESMDLILTSSVPVVSRAHLVPPVKDKGYLERRVHVRVVAWQVSGVMDSRDPRILPKTRVFPLPRSWNWSINSSNCASSPACLGVGLSSPKQISQSVALLIRHCCSSVWRQLVPFFSSGRLRRGRSFGQKSVACSSLTAK